MAGGDFGRFLLIGLGAVGTGVLVRQAIKAYRERGELGSDDRTSPPLPLPTSPRMPTPASPPPASPPPAANWWHFDPLVERWRPAVTAAARKYELPVGPLLKWIKIESGGDLSSIGSVYEVGPFQLNLDPHESGNDSRFGATLEGLRAIAKRSDELARQGHAVGDVSWLSPAELDMAIGAGVRKVAAARETVRHLFAKTGIPWSEGSPDFGTAVKQIHAAPAVLGELLPKITARDGRPPATWAEFHHLVMTYPVDQMSGIGKNGKPYGLRLLGKIPSKHGLANRLEDTLHNAEEFGQTSKFGPAWPA